MKSSKSRIIPTTAQKDANSSKRTSIRLAPRAKSRGGPEKSNVIKTEQSNATKAKNDTPETVRDFLRRTFRKGVKGVKTEFRNERRYVPSEEGNAAAQLISFNLNTARNRYRDVYCLEKTRVQLRNHATDYIHANRVSAGSMIIICCQGPMTNTVDDFWHMIWQEECAQIAMLCDPFESGRDKCLTYWPTKEKQTTKFTAYTVCNLKIETQELHGDKAQLVTSHLQIRRNGAPASRVVIHRQWKKWPDRGAPTDIRALLRLRQKMSEYRVNECVVVHCSAGIGRTGTLVVVDMCLAGIDSGKEIVDVCAAMRRIRDQRLHSIQTEQQYLFVYRAVLEYILLKWAKEKCAESEAWVAEYEKDQPKAKR